MKIKPFFILSCLLLVFVVACQPITTNRASSALLSVSQQDEDERPSISELAFGAENLQTLFAAIDAADLEDALADPEIAVTVFAPTDEAFDALPEGLLDALLADTELLTGILLYHVVDAIADSEAVLELDSVTTVIEEDITINVTDDGVLLNDSATVTDVDIFASNGVIHLIDQVLIPPSLDLDALLASLADTAEEEADEDAEEADDEAGEEESADTEEEVADDEDEEEADDSEGDASDEEGEEIVFLNEEEGGLVRLTGVATYTNPFFTEGTVQPMVILEDQAGFVNRDRNYLFPIESQVLGQLTSSFTESPFTYSMVLPIEPAGGLNDVDNDGVDEIGVQVFATAYWDNVFGGPFLEERDVAGGGWSGNMVSTILSSEPGFEGEIIAGKLIVYAPDDEQSFPINFGEDGKLFTEDDQEMVDLPQGYTVVNLDTVPFTFDRSREQQLDLLEASGAQQRDFSDLGYADAFDAMVDDFIERYAFTDYKDVDWEALREEYKPIFEEAEERGDNLTYRRAIREFIREVPDGHLNGGLLPEDFRAQLGGEVGLGVVETTDGRILIDYVDPAGAGAVEGVELAAEVIALNDEPIEEAIANSPTIISPFSREQDEQLAKLRNVLRFPPGTDMTLTFVNPGDDEEQTIEMTAVPGFGSFLQDYAFGDVDGFEMPVEYDILPNGAAYATITSFLDNRLLQIQLWERLMANMRDNQVDTLILDMRVNGGGFGYIADYMASYLFDEVVVVGNTAEYDELTGEYVIRPENEEKLILPEPELRFLGEIVLLVGPGCASACEFFSYNLTLRDNTTIMGQYGTPGLGGGRTEMLMPDGETVSITVSRQVDADGNIHIEGLGVDPEIFLPIDEESILYEGDYVLDKAIEFLASPRPEEPEESDEDADTSEESEDAEEGDSEEATDEDGEESATDEESSEEVTDEDDEAATDEDVADDSEEDAATEEGETDEDASDDAGDTGNADEETTGDDESTDDGDSEDTAEEPLFELAGELAVGDVLDAEIASGDSVYYSVSATAGEMIDILADAENQRELDLTMTIYNVDGDILFESDDRSSKTVNPGISELEISEDVTLIVELSVVGDGSGSYRVYVLAAE